MDLTSFFCWSWLRLFLPPFTHIDTTGMAHPPRHRHHRNHRGERRQDHYQEDSERRQPSQRNARDHVEDGSSAEARDTLKQQLAAILSRTKGEGAEKSSSSPDQHLPPLAQVRGFRRMLGKMILENIFAQRIWRLTRTISARFRQPCSSL